MNPERIQLKRTKGWRMPPNTVKVDRSSRYGNPFNATQSYVPVWRGAFPVPLIKLNDPPSLGRCVDLFAVYLATRILSDKDFLEPLRGKNLACWCKPGDLCHADILLQVANQ